MSEIAHDAVEAVDGGGPSTDLIGLETTEPDSDADDKESDSSGDAELDMAMTEAADAGPPPTDALIDMEHTDLE